jgi:hypothetical protein
MDQATRIATEESQRFLATFEASDQDGLNNVDLSGSPTLRATINDKFEPSDKDGLNNVDTSGMPTTNRLANFVRNPDVESLARVAEELRSPELIAEVTDQREEAEARAFVKVHPDYQPDDGNYDLIRDWITQRGLAFTADNLGKAFRSLVRSGEMEALGGRHNLRESEKLSVMALAKSGHADAAVAQYLEFAFPNADDRWVDGQEFLADVDTLAVRNEAVAFVHYHSRPIQDSPEWEKYKRGYFKRRPMVTMADLDACWELFQKDEKQVQRDRLVFGQPDAPPPTAQELDALDDEGIDKLYHKTLRHYAYTAKKSAGILV